MIQMLSKYIYIYIYIYLETFRDNHDVTTISNLNFVWYHGYIGYVDQQKLMRPPDAEGKRWPEAWTFPLNWCATFFRWSFTGCQGMAQWAKLSLVAIQKMIKDEFHPENWMATEASGSASRDPQIQQIQQLLVQFQGVVATLTKPLGGAVPSLALIPRFDEFLRGYILGLSSYTSFSAEAKTYHFPPLRLHWKMAMLTSQLGRSHDS